MDVARSRNVNCAVCNYGGTKAEVLVHVMLMHLAEDKFPYHLVELFTKSDDLVCS